MFRTVRSRIVTLITLVVVAVVVLTAVTVSLAVQRAAKQETEQPLRDDAVIYQDLLTYGSSNDSWDDVAPVVKDLAVRHGKRVALAGAEGVFVDSDELLGIDSGKLNASPQAVIDPRNPFSEVVVNPTVISIKTDDQKGRDERKGRISACLVALHADAVVSYRDDAPDISFKEPISDENWPSVLNCLLPVQQPLPDDSLELGLTMDVLQQCLAPTLGEVGWVNSGTGPTVIDDVFNERVVKGIGKCIEAHRSDVSAPPVQLFIGSEGHDPLSFQGLATVETALIATCIITVAGVAGLVLTTRIVKPLRTLTAAATELGEGGRGIRVEVPDRTEIGTLAETFNSMAESLDRSEQARRQLIADIAHELGNPLVTIGGGLEAIQDGIYQPSPEVIGSLSEEATHLQRLVTDLRELALADTGTLPIKRARVDLAELATATVAVHLPVARAAGVELRVVAEGIHSVLGDETRLRQVLANLLGNAIHHTPAGGKVEVRVMTLPGAVRLEVSDTGEGIAAEHLPHVFERFWRADPSRHRDSGRTGLGLAISDTLVRAQGGTIAVASTPGVGTTFTVDLPLPG